jgi:S-adenosylmethionine hydrolase
MRDSPIITLTTDFGLKDPFAGLMKGVILRINPNAQVVDISHNIQRHNIFEASQVIAMSHKYFPPTTIHVAVVDPGVGSLRRPVMVVTENYYFLGPDNGIFSSVFEESGTPLFKVIHLTSSHYFLSKSGSTFHGRDIFAPAAAWLSKGIEAYKFGDQIDDYSKIEIPIVEVAKNNVSGEIVAIDNFGNAISNIKRDDLSKLARDVSTGTFKIVYNNEPLSMVNYYAESKGPGLASLINSFGHLELFTYQDNAAEQFNIKIGDSVSVSLA